MFGSRSANASGGRKYRRHTSHAIQDRCTLRVWCVLNNSSTPGEILCLKGMSLQVLLTLDFFIDLGKC